MIKVAFQGVEGAYSELAARRFFQPKVGAGQLTTEPLAAFADVFRRVSSKKADFGILPVENSLTGSIHQNYDLMLSYPVEIVGEWKLPVQHALLAVKGVRLGDITEVYSHPQGLAQCAGFLRRALPKAEAVAFFDTAGAARFVSTSERRDVAAIASAEAGKRYGLSVLKLGIQDHQENYTRFLVIRRSVRGKVAAVSGKGLKTSVVFSLKNSQGALYKALSAFAVRDIDLLKIESRPIPGKPWHYMFYLDFVRPEEAQVSARALDHLREIADFCRLLGSYQPG